MKTGLLSFAANEYFLHLTTNPPPPIFRVFYCSYVGWTDFQSRRNQLTRNLLWFFSRKKDCWAVRSNDSTKNVSVMFLGDLTKNLELYSQDRGLLCLAPEKFILSRKHFFWVCVQYFWHQTERPKTKILCHVFDTVSRKHHSKIFGRTVWTAGTQTSICRNKNLRKMHVLSIIHKVTGRLFILISKGHSRCLPGTVTFPPQRTGQKPSSTAFTFSH